MYSAFSCRVSRGIVQHRRPKPARRFPFLAADSNLRCRGNFSFFPSLPARNSSPNLGPRSMKLLVSRDLSLKRRWRTHAHRTSFSIGPYKYNPSVTTMVHFCPCQCFLHELYTSSRRINVKIVQKGADRFTSQGPCPSEVKKGEVK